MIKRDFIKPMGQAEPGVGRQLAGWTAVTLGTAAAAIWAFWGAVENFHEGWWQPSLTGNLAMMLIQYASPFLIITGLNLLSLRFPRIGGGIYILIVLFFTAWVFRRGSRSLGAVSSWLPVTAVPVLVGALFLYGRPRPKHLAYLVSVAVPVLIFLGFSIEPAYRVSRRWNDGQPGVCFVEGNEVALTWAPPGPGWPDRGIEYQQAAEICSRLSPDGKKLLDSAVNIWRLPTVEETVRSLSRHGKNCRGVFQPSTGRATYEVTPDKESPLWDQRSMVIYWWTSTQADSNSYYVVCYNGRVTTQPRHCRLGSLGFRAVKDSAR